MSQGVFAFLSHLRVEMRDPKARPSNVSEKIGELVRILFRRPLHFNILNGRQWMTYDGN
jgi:hypothetical protein